jgi:hypothetical protein
LRNEITAHGLEPDHDLLVLRSLYGGELTEHAAMLMNRLTEIVGGTDTRAEEELKESVLEGLQAEIELQKQRRDVAAGILAVEVASDIQEPAGPALETLLRYRSANTREFKDLLDSLERIRRLRRAES